MYKIAVASLFSLVLLVGCTAKAPAPSNTIQTDQNLDTSIQVESDIAEVDPQAEQTSKIYRDDVIEFVQDFQYESSVLVVSKKMLEIYFKGSSASENLAGGDISIQVEPEADLASFEKELSYLDTQAKQGGGTGAIDYNFPEATRNAEANQGKIVKIISYPNDWRVYLIRFEDQDGYIYIMPSQNSSMPEAVFAQSTALIETVKFLD